MRISRKPSSKILVPLIIAVVGIVEVVGGVSLNNVFTVIAGIGFLALAIAKAYEK